MLNLSPHIDEFFRAIAAGRVEVYNEFSLQHEIGTWLRAALPPEYRVQFERPASYFGVDEALNKKEIDIAVFAPATGERHAMELKFPRNGAYPKRMFAACDDLCFLERLCAAGFSGGWFLMLADDPLFRTGPATDGIYRFFRGGEPLHGRIDPPVGPGGPPVILAGRYTLEWRQAGEFAYLAVPVTAAMANQRPVGSLRLG